MTHPTTHLTRRSALGLLAATPALIAAPTILLAATPRWYTADGAAINGYDPVAYFTDAKPVEGNRDFALDWDGATWLFASAANRDLFLADTMKYAPKYGGYCAYAVSRGYTATTSPRAWSVYEDRLYLNYSRSVRALWAVDKAGNVAKADANWPRVLEA
ncbi:MAG: YHS domain-containing (seleno)protein [Brevirhabdus sp.]